MGFSFTIESFAKIYSDYYKNVSAKEFSKRLWGDIWFDKTTRKFSKEQPKSHLKIQRSFIEFILEPLYKIFSHALGSENEELAVHNKILTQGKKIL
jgi:116 kDa U5 small nuclear ribonucleoprotein component